MKASRRLLCGVFLLNLLFFTSCETDLFGEEEDEFFFEDGDFEEGNSDEEGTINSANLTGIWDQVGVCVNGSGIGNNFRFDATSGRVFQSDCNDTCPGSGVTTFFNFTVSGNTVNIVPTSVSEYCGVQEDAPPSFSAPWSISGNILTLDGQDFRRR